MLIRWLTNRLAGRRFHRREVLQTDDIPTLISEMAGNRVRNVTLDISDFSGDYYGGVNLDTKLDALRELPTKTKIRGIHVDTYLGPESVKRYVEIYTAQRRVTAKYVTEVGKREENNKRNFKTV